MRFFYKTNMKTQAYIYLESDQVYGDYIDHFYNRPLAKVVIASSSGLPVRQLS